MDKLYDIKLTYNELKGLDGKVSDKAQEIIEVAKKENQIGFDIPVMNEIINHSIKTGELTWRSKQISNCDYCDKKRDYHRYPRSSRSHNKGDKNYNKPKYYSGIKFNEGFVTVQGLGDMCKECCEKHNVKERLIDYILENDLKIEIQKNDYKPGKYLKDPIRICFQCQQEMRESEMIRKSTVMGDGTYPSECPHCGAESVPFGRGHKSTKEFDVVVNPAASEEILYITELYKEKEIKVLQSKKNKELFFLDDGEWRNGNRLLKLKTSTRKYYSHFDFCYKEKVIDFLKKQGYKEANKSWEI